MFIFYCFSKGLIQTFVQPWNICVHLSFFRTEYKFLPVTKHENMQYFWDIFNTLIFILLLVQQKYNLLRNVWVEKHLPHYIPVLAQVLCDKNAKHARSHFLLVYYRRTCLAWKPLSWASLWSWRFVMTTRVVGLHGSWTGWRWRTPKTRKRNTFLFCLFSFICVTVMNFVKLCFVYLHIN